MMAALQDIASTSSCYPRGHIFNGQQIGGSSKVHMGDVFNIMLPEDVAKEAAILANLMSNAETACKALFDLIGTTKNAPIDIDPISRDLEDLYIVLGTLKALLSDEESKEGVVWSALSDNLSKVVETCMLLFADITTRLQEFASLDESPRNTGKGPSQGSLTKEDVGALRSNLISCKITLNMAISMANLYQTSLTRDAVVEHRMKLEDLLRQMEDEKASKLPPAPTHRDIDRASVIFDRTYAIRHYISSAASVFSEAATMRPVPSMQVSSYLESESFGTVQTFFTAHADLASKRCSQIFVKGLPTKKTMILQVGPLHTIESIKDKIRERLDRPRAAFEFTYQNKVLFASHETLEGYNIFHDSTLFCVSFRPDEDQPGAWGGNDWETRISCVTIKRVAEYDVELLLDTDEELVVQDLKDLYASRVVRLRDFSLVHRGMQLSHDLPLITGNFTLSGGRYIVYAVETLQFSSAGYYQVDVDPSISMVENSKKAPRTSIVRRLFKIRIGKMRF